MYKCIRKNVRLYDNSYDNSHKNNGTPHLEHVSRALCPVTRWDPEAMGCRAPVPDPYVTSSIHSGGETRIFLDKKTIVGRRRHQRRWFSLATASQ